MRLDVELVLRGMFPTRNKAAQAIKDGIIFCDGKKIEKPSFEVNHETKVEIVGETLKYVSRAGLKLEKAIEKFNLNLHKKTMLDIGSSTGGFSDCAIQKGIEKIFAVDVGTDVMDKNLRQNPKITLFESTDIRNLDTNCLDKIDIITIDISFISVTKILDVLKNIDAEEIVLLIKPQFECGKEIADKYRGVVLDKSVHKDVILNVINSFKDINYILEDLTFSPIKGGNGNIEYLAYFKKSDKLKLINIPKIIDEAFSSLK